MKPPDAVVCRRFRAGVLIALLAVGVLSACSGGGAGRARRPAGSAVWVDPRMAPLAPSAARALRAAGVEEVFVAAANLVAGDEGARLDSWASDLAHAAPAHTPVTLTVLGSWPPPADFDPGQAARAVAEGLVGLRAAAEEADLLPVGVHLHLDRARGGGSGEASPAPAGGKVPDGVAGEEARLDLLSAFVEALRDRLPDDLFVSVSLERSWIGAPGWQDLAESADFTVPFLYGDPPGAADRAESWDPAQVEAGVKQMETLGRDYLLGVRSIGSASRVGASGEVRDVTTRASLPALADNKDLRRTIGDAFGGVGRLVYSFQAQRRTTVAGWDLSPGETVRVVRTAPSLLYNLRQRMQAASDGHLLGLLVNRLPGPGEELSPSAEALAALFEEAPPEPALRANLVVQSRSRQTVVLGVTLENPSSLSTDLALSDGNYLSIETGDAFIEGVEPGEFTRYTLWRQGREVRPGVGWREPDEVRLYTPMLVAGETVSGARVSVRSRTGGGTAVLSGRFYLPDGRELSIARAGGDLAQLPGPGEAIAHSGE